MDDSGALGVIVGIVVAIAFAGAGVGAALYATDYSLTADVQDKQCGLSLNIISVKTRWFGIDHDVEGVPQHECGIVQVGDEVQYHLRSKHTTIYRNGECFYDSETGPTCGAGPLALI